MNPKPYSPFRAAAVAAFAELSSEQAQRYYSLKAQKDFQTAFDSTVTLCAWIYQLAEMTYMMGMQCRTWYDNLEPQPQVPIPSSMALAPATMAKAPHQEYALLPPATPSIIHELKTARASLALAQESDRLAQEALGYVVEQVVKIVSVEPLTTQEVAVAALHEPVATAKLKRQRQTKAKAVEKGAITQPKQARGRAKATDLGR